MKATGLSAIDLKNNIHPLQILYVNNTDEIKKVCAFEIFNKNPEGVTAEISYNNSCSFEYMKKYFYENPHLSSMIRLQSTALNGVQAEQVFYEISKTPMGSMISMPAIVLADEFNKNQFQSGILDVQYNFLMDGFSSDFEFNLLPKTTLVLTMFFSEGIKGRSSKKLDKLRSKCKNKHSGVIGSLVIENSSDVAKELLIFDFEKYKEYEKDDNLKIFSLFDVRHEELLHQITNINTIFNSVRTFVTKGSSENQKRQVRVPLEFSSGSKYHPSIELDGNEFQYGICDMNIIGEQLSSDNPMKITVMPKTRVVYLFKHQEKIKASTVTPSFLSVEMENTSDEQKTFDALHYNPSTIKHEISYNKIKFNKDTFKANFMRIFLYNDSQIGDKFKIIGERDDGVKIEREIYFVNHINEMKFVPNLVEIDFDFFDLPLSKCHLLFELKKGDGVNIIFAKKIKQDVSDNTPMFKPLSIMSKEDFEKSAMRGVDVIDSSFFFPKRKIDSVDWIPLVFENKTDDEQEIILPNNEEGEIQIPNGVTVNIGGGFTNYRQFLDYLLSRKNESMNLQRIFGMNTIQITNPIVVRSYDSEKPVDKIITTQNYLSPMQFTASILNTAGIKLLDLNRVDDGTETQKDGEGREYNIKKTKIEKKQAIVYKLKPNTKVVFCVSLEKDEYNHSEKPIMFEK